MTPIYQEITTEETGKTATLDEDREGLKYSKLSSFLYQFT